jgi:hypothetical protein
MAASPLADAGPRYCSAVFAQLVDGQDHHWLLLEAHRSKRRKVCNHDWRIFKVGARHSRVLPQ